MMKYRILRQKETAEFLGVSLTTLWRYSKDPKFPRKVRLGLKSVGYRSDELERFINENQEEVQK